MRSLLRKIMARWNGQLPATVADDIVIDPPDELADTRTHLVALGREARALREDTARLTEQTTITERPPT